MTEQIKINKKVATDAQVPFFVDRIEIDFTSNTVIVVLQSAQIKERVSASYAGNEAKPVIAMLNKSNFAGVSMKKKILQRLVADGKLSGEVSGEPD